ncbi:MAG: zinc ABC transporter substrate-binding protein [Bacilli bacterium]|nr:zinc ABC transporter substrate-binding protein [Bacilli bacterium]
MRIKSLRKIRFLLPLLGLCSCGPTQLDRPLVVASFYPVWFLADAIGGDAIDVENLTPAGTEPHDFELVPSAVRKIADASLCFVNGLGMEAWTDSLLPSYQKKTIILSEGLPTQSVDGAVDPHIWLDTALYRQMGEKVLSSMVQALPSYAGEFRANFASFCADLTEMEASAKEIAASIAGKPIAVSHAAYGYLCNEFHLKQIYINGLSPDQEPTQQTMTQVLDAIASYGIDTVFFEELASPAVAQAIAKASGAKAESLNPLEGLEEDEIAEGATYFSVYLENLHKIQEAKP